MDKLENFILPIIIGVGLFALVLAKADAGSIIWVARIIGIILAIFLSLSFLFRLAMRFIGPKMSADLQKEYDSLKAEIEADEQLSKNESGN